MSDESNNLSALLDRKKELLIKRDLLYRDKRSSPLNQSFKFNTIDSSRSSDSVIENSFSSTEEADTYKKKENQIKKVLPTCEINECKENIQKKSKLDPAKQITVISNVVLKKSDNIPEIQNSKETTLIEDLEASINKNVKYPLQEFDEKTTAKFLEDISECSTSNTINKSSLYELEDAISVVELEKPAASEAITIPSEHELNKTRALTEECGTTSEINYVKETIHDSRIPIKDTRLTFQINYTKDSIHDVSALIEDAIDLPGIKSAQNSSHEIDAPNVDATLTSKKNSTKDESHDISAGTDGSASILLTNTNYNNHGIYDLTEGTGLIPQSSSKKDSCFDVIVTTPKRARKHRTTSKFTKSCMDFLLDDEKTGDYSDGSSEKWSPKESDSSSLSDEEINRKKKKLKKRKIKPEQPINIKKQIRENKSKKRKQLKEKGLAYETASGTSKKPKTIKENPCKENKCMRKCFEITEERRQSLFTYFWGLEENQRKNFIVQCATRRAIKRKKTDTEVSRRGKTYEYFINEGEGRRQVCQQFLLSTLDITQTYLLYNIDRSQEGIPLPDSRRRHAPDKYSDATKLFAKNYIESLPVLPSHYSRKNSSKLYLPQEFKNVSNLYRHYVHHCNKESQEFFLSERLFINLFRTEYNIGFHIPKKDKCKFCIRYENNQNEKDEAYKLHIEEKTATYQRCKLHSKLEDNHILTASFDLQKVLNTPHGESMLLYYSRKYTMYNLTVYESGTQNGYCYTWGESDGKRGSSEIGTCLFKYLDEVDKRGIQYLILYCDSCSGQNKNRVILTVFKTFLETAKNLDVIQINYLLPGHTYMPVDSMHSVIEREVRNMIVWSPLQWPTLMQAARKKPHPYEVTVLEHSDFINWNIKADKIFTTKTLSNKDLKLKNLRIATFNKKQLNVMKVKYTMKEDGETYEIPLEAESGTGTRKKLLKKGKGPVNENLQLYAENLPVSMAKYKDLKKLCDNGTIPKTYQQFYVNLPYTSNVIDTVSENEEEVEEEIKEGVEKEIEERVDEGVKVVDKEIAIVPIKCERGRGRGRGLGRGQKGKGRGRGLGKGQVKGDL